MVTTAPFDVSDRRAIGVGTEFVRQYYTVLNSNPNSVHRFYSGDSAFVYGGVDRLGYEELPVRGQHNIHQRILAIGFKDPRCKILQIDAMFSEANCVLVQACGELSNDGGPMRRFMQSFLLKPKGEKAYYVLNSIFRYQDEVFGDDVDDTASSTVEEQRIGTDTGNTLDTPAAPEEKKTNGCYNDNLPQMTLAVTDAAIVSMSNGDSKNYHEDAKAPVSELENTKEDVQELAVTEELSAEEIAPAAVDVEAKPAVNEGADIVVPQEAPKPKSWAALLSDKTAAAPARRNVRVTQPADHVKAESQPQKQEPAVVNGSGGQHEHVANGDQQHQRRSVSSSASNSLAADRPTQLFVGNLSPDLTEDELLKFFSTFGEVDYLRINQGNAKMGSAKREVPNFGFVVFRDRATMMAVLNARSLTIGDRRVNVEERRVQAQGNMERGAGGANRGAGGGRGGAAFRGRGAGGRGGGGRAASGNVGQRSN